MINDNDNQEIREEWQDHKGYYVYRRRHAQLTRSSFRRLGDGDIFFYALLLEKHHWRSDDEILDDIGDYRQRFFNLYSDEYHQVIQTQMIAQHSHKLHHSILYDEIVTSLLEHHEIDVSEIIRIQLQVLQQSPHLSCQQFQFDLIFHMGTDQYAVFSVLSSSFDQL